MIATREEMRTAIGQSARIFAGQGVEIGEHGWTAFSGARSVDYNVALCTGDGDSVDATVERVLAIGCPAVVMLAGQALGEAGRLTGRDWTCIGQQPMMYMSLRAQDGFAAAPEDPAVRRLEIDDLPAARELLDRVFGTGPELAQVALPDSAFGTLATTRVWGAFDDGNVMRSMMAFTGCGRALSGWSMATDPASRGAGFGRRTLMGAFTAAAAAGLEYVTFISSPAGEPFYRRLGIDEVERWQMWSRPRWVLGRG